MIDLISPEGFEKLAHRVADILESRKKTEEPPKEVLTFRAKEVALLTTSDVQTIRIHAKLGILKGTKTGKSWIFTKEAINQYIERK